MRKTILFILLCSLLVGSLGCRRESSGPDTSGLINQNASGAHSIGNSEDSSKEETASDHVYTASTVKVHEINDFAYLLPNGEMTEEGKNTYVFEAGIPIADRESFIEAEQQLLAYLDSKSKEAAEKSKAAYTFFLSESYMDRSDSAGNTAFLLNASLHSWRQILTTIQLLEGDDVLYGYAYAKANALAGELGWETDSVIVFSEEEIREFAAADPGRMTLIYPCFIEPYSTANQIDLAKAVAQEIYKTLGESLDEETFIAAIQSYTKEHNIPYTETYLRFMTGGRSVPLMIRTQYIEEWITREVQTDSTYMRSEYEIPDSLNWQKNMMELIRLRELTDKVIADSCTSLDFEPSAPKEVVWFQGKPSDSYAGWTSFGGDSITVSSAYVIAHEYIHYIHSHLVHLPHIQWCIEALAEYYSWPMEIELGNLFRLAAGFEALSVPEYTAISIPSILNRMRTYEKSPTDILYLGERGIGQYGSYFLIGQYLVETYGEDVFVQLMIYPENAESLTGKTLDEIVEDWDRYISEMMEAL